MKDHSVQFFESTGAARMLPQLLVRTDSGAIVDVNRASEGFYGWPRVTMQGMLISDLDTGVDGRWSAPISSTDEGDGRRERRVHRVAAGTARAVEMCACVVTVGASTLLHVVVQDVTVQRPAADARHARRIVHDFNNLLTVLRGSAVFLRDALEPASQASEDLASIENATDRAENLMKELLAVLPKT
ncbi:MAG: hypothetical protein ABIW79_06955 [Gemmatimonas sp.]